MKHIKKTFHIFIGLFLLLVGIAGLVLPILNGVVFLLLGLIILSFESPYLEKHLEAYSKKNKHIHHWYEKLNQLMKKLFRRN